MPRFAANLTMMFNEWAFLDRFGKAAEAGFRGVEFLFPYDHTPEEVARQVAGASVEVALFNLPPGDWANGERGLAALPDRFEDVRASVDLALTYARPLGVRCLHMMAGLAGPGDAAAQAAYRRSLAYAAPRLADAGIDLLIEPINGRDMPGYFLRSFDQAARLIAELGLPNLKLQFDIYHRQILHGDVLTGLADLLPITGHIQIASVPKRHEPGSGELDDARIFERLDAMGYAGWVGCEYRPAAGTIEGLDWLARQPA